MLRRAQNMYLLMMYKFIQMQTQTAYLVLKTLTNYRETITNSAELETSQTNSQRRGLTARKRIDLEWRDLPEPIERLSRVYHTLARVKGFPVCTIILQFHCPWKRNFQPVRPPLKM